MSTKTSILTILEKEKGNWVSGEELAKMLNISRAAIWKSMRTLKEEGYKIDALTNRGYRLLMENDILSQQGICLHCPNIHPSIHVYKSTASTNEIAKQLAIDHAPHGSVVISEQQVSGKGRLGRSFFSPKDTGIYLSALMRWDLHTLDSTLITTAVANIVCQTIEFFTDKQPKIKWVNDIFLDDKKICGILTEATSDFESGRVEHIIIGIGINFLPPKEGYPKELESIATSLFQHDEIHPTRNEFIGELLHRLFHLDDVIKHTTFLEEYRSRSLLLGKEVIVEYLNQTFSALALDIHSDGRLKIEKEDGTQMLLHSGDVRIKRKL